MKPKIPFYGLHPEFLVEVVRVWLQCYFRIYKKIILTYRTRGGRNRQKEHRILPKKLAQETYRRARDGNAKSKKYFVVRLCCNSTQRVFSCHPQNTSLQFNLNSLRKEYFQSLMISACSNNWDNQERCGRNFSIGHLFRLPAFFPWGLIYHLHSIC